MMAFSTQSGFWGFTPWQIVPNQTLCLVSLMEGVLKSVSTLSSFMGKNKKERK